MKTKIALILTLVLLLLVFAGCQRTPAATGDNTSGSTQASTDSAAVLPDNTSAPTNDTAAATDSTTAPTGNTTGTAASADVKLTAAEAEKIALEHANLTADQVTRLHTEKDLDERIPHYDVEFHAGGYEYDYEINAQTGEILKSEKEWD